MRLFLGNPLALALLGMAAPSVLGAASPLSPYLVRPADIPAGCAQIQGSYPLNEKIKMFYGYAAYKIVLPPLWERHAQSFDCGGRKGSLYFFAYRSGAERESAELFARPVLANASPAPLVLDWSNGFVIVSFAPPPPALVQRLEAKLRPASAPAIAAPYALPAISSSPAVSRAPAAKPAVVRSTATVPVVSVSPSATKDLPKNPLGRRGDRAVGVRGMPQTERYPSSLPTGQAGPPSPTRGEGVFGKGSKAAELPDLSDSLLAQLSARMECRTGHLSAEEQDFCEFLTLFGKGQAFNPLVPPESARAGVAYRLDAFGRLNERYYDAVVGTGRPGEVALFPMKGLDGVEDFEMQAVIDAKRRNAPLPANELVERFKKHPRPAHATVFPTQGRSRVMPVGKDKRVYWRQSGSRWILIGVEGPAADQQLRSPVVMAALD